MDKSISKNSWGYIEGHDYKTPGEIICALVDTVSKNGALLLSTGPRPDGTIPEPEQHILLEIGHWLAVNGEAIYGTRPWQVFGEGPTEVVAGYFNDTKQTSFTSEDIQFTCKDNTLYAMILKWPDNGRVVIKAVAAGRAKVHQIDLLGDACPPKWNLSPAGLELDLTNCLLSPCPVTLRIS